MTRSLRLARPLGLIAGGLLLALGAWLGLPRLPAPENRLPLPLGGQVQQFNAESQAAMRAAGMTWVKWQIRFSHDADPDIARDRIKRTHDAGFFALLTIRGDKDELAAGGGAYLDAYAAFLGEAARHGADAIEVWREMNVDRAWPPGQIDPAHYALMLRKAYAAIKAANPHTIVISGALLPTNAESALGRVRVWNDDTYYAGMAKAGAAETADCIGLAYTNGALPPVAQFGDPRGEHPIRYLPAMLRRVAFAFREVDIPLCLTEIGYLAPVEAGALPAGYNWASNTSVADQAAWLAQALPILSNFEAAPIALAIIWNIDFDADDAADAMSLASYAIIRPDGGCPACDAIAKLRR